MNPGLAYLVDTNVLIYAYDAADPAKRRRAIEVLAALASSGTGALSVQVLSEFYVNVTRKPKAPLTAEQARDTSIRLCRSWHVLELEARTHLGAVAGVLQHQMSYWDALLWATAQQSFVPNILTEDQQHGRLIEEIRYLNPFDADFELAQLA
jgi:predicted nucleic acid-binding protein